MKIAILTSGSIESTLSYRALSFAKNMDRLGHTVYIITPSQDKYTNFKTKKLETIKGVKIIHPIQFNTKYRVINFLPYIPHTIVILFNLQLDIVHIYKPTPLTVCGILLKIKRNVKSVVDMDDLGSKVMQQENNNPLIVHLVQFSEWLALSTANGIICASSYLTKKYKKKYNSTPVKWISNGIDFDNTKKTSKNKSDAQYSIVVVGSLNRMNIVQPLIKALPIVLNKLGTKKIKIIIIGDGVALPKIKEYAKKLNVDEFIEYTGWIPMDSVPKYLSQGALGYTYMPNEETIIAASNLKLFQYMANGVVPIVSDVGDLPFYIENGRAGYIAKANNINSLTSTLVSAIKNKKERYEKTKICKEIILKKFLWNILTDDLIKMYNKVI